MPIDIPTMAAQAKVAAQAAGSGASEDSYFAAIHSPLASVMGAAVDAVIKSRAADPARALASWLTAALGGEPAHATTSSRQPPVAAPTASADTKRLKEELRELEDSARLLETDNDMLKKIVEDYEKEMSSLRKELKAAKAAKAAAKAPPSDEVGAFTLDDDSD